MDHARIIGDLAARSGSAALARKFRRAPATVARWRTEGIPREFWARVLRTTDRAGAGITEAQLAGPAERAFDLVAATFGTQRALADEIGVDFTRISHWLTDGIPPRHWPAVLRIARQSGYALTLEDLETGSPLLRSAAA
jgi:hypothetical protein